MNSNPNKNPRETPALDPAVSSIAEPFSRVPLWVLALGTTLGMQTVASALDQSLPIIAPLLTAGTGIAPERIGNLSSLNSLGTVLFLLFGPPLLARLGPVRALQAGALCAVFGLSVAATGWWPMLVFAALIMGIGYGPSPPAGSRILNATAPAQHRTLIFSIKQAGAPAGAALAGLILAPVASAFGWKSALLVSMAIGLGAACFIAPARRKLDSERDPARAINLASLFHPRVVVAPFGLLVRNRSLLTISGLAFSFAMVQGSLFSFSVTYLVTSLHLPLAAAGLVYACMQFSGVFARIFLGWLADWTGQPSRNLTAQAFVAAGLVVCYGMLPNTPTFFSAALLAGATGFFAASWNGIYMAEIARLSPPDQIVEVTSSSTLIAFLGYIIGPSLFSVLVTLTSQYRIPFFVIATQLALMGVVQVIVMLQHRSALSPRSPAQ